MEVDRVTNDSRPPRTLRTEVLWLVISIAFCFVFSAIGQWATFQSIDGWYRELTKPSWNPPNWIFAPVWTTLYISMGVAAWLAWRAGSPQGFQWALTAHVIQLILNATWSVLFFGMQRPGWAFLEILCLWMAILATTLLFFLRNRWAGLLMLPYLIWVRFAAALNYSLWQLNVSTGGPPT